MKKTPGSRPLKTLNEGNLSGDSSRRTFVKNVAALSVLSTTTSLSPEADSEPTTQSKYTRHSSQTDCDVAIIGAGLAGLITARELKQQGFTCQILEARNRLGGRVFTTKFAGHKVELGGNWTFWGNPHRIPTVFGPTGIPRDQRTLTVSMGFLRSSHTQTD